MNGVHAVHDMNGVKVINGVNGVNGHMKPIKSIQKNGHANGHTNGHMNGHSNGYKNGHSNGYTNGYSVEKNNVKSASLNYKDIIPYGTNQLVTDEYIHGVVDKIINFLQKSNDRSEKVIEFATPEKLQDLIDFTLPEEEQSLDSLHSYIDLVLKYAVKTGHPNYYNQLWAGVDTHSMLGEWIGAATNTALFTYEVAPVYIVMEKFVIDKLLSYAGLDGGEGQFFPGGSVCNISAISLARYRYCPNIKAKGTYGMKPFIVFASEEGHYSIGKAAGLLGFGTDHIVKVKTDSRGKMIPEELEKEIVRIYEEGEATPLVVCATAGTTVVGAYDPLNEIADVCEKYGLWFHVDAAWGGGCLVSKKYRHLMNGCNRADSITWDPHKLMNITQQCSVLLVKEKGLLLRCYGQNAKYLFQKDKKLYDTTWDTGDRTFQCGRKNDVLKLHLMWKAKGSKGIEEQMDNAFDNARYLGSEIQKRKNFELVREVECTNVCFRFIPKSLMNIPDCQEKTDRLAKVPPEIKKRMTVEGSLMIGYQPLKDCENVFRMILVSPTVNRSDMDFLLDEIERLGDDL